MSPSATDRPPSSVTWRFRLIAAALVLTALAFAQRPGRLVSDTKFDLVVDPGGMLARAFHLWDPSGGFGQVQNQAYGYLFPMGPFFWLGDLISVPGWAVQRLWWSLLLVVAFLGVVKLCGVLGVGSPGGRIIAGFAYALSPRILTTLGPISIEAWPSALAPWVLVPLVVGARAGSPRRAAALSALAVAAVGGVNAAATFAVIPLGAVWLLTRRKGRRRRALMVWWPLLVAVGTSWWLVPLLLLGQYSPPFLDYIETSAVTTFPTTLFDALRGTSHWVPYVDRTWQAGNDLISTGYVVLNSAVLILFGVVGVMSRGNRHRQFLALSLLLGLVMVTLGHSGPVQGWFAGTERALLDGVLAPLRNVHKFDPMIRLPLVIGLAHLVGTFDRPRVQGRDEDPLARIGVLALAVVAVVGAAAPAVTARLAPADDFEGLPTHWRSAVDWLERNGDGTTSLLVPGSSFATYLWGTPEDEPVQALGGVPWAIRNAVPLAPPGTIRMLDAVEARLSAGRPSPALAGYLRRAGIGHLVVRNDLAPNGDLPDPVLVHQVLDESPGIHRVAAFGPRLGGPVRLDALQRDRRAGSRTKVVADGGWHAAYPAVEVYAVDGGRRAVATESAPVVAGGPEDLLGLMESGLLDDAPTVLAVDARQDPGSAGWFLTDGLRRREANFARIHDSKSATLTADDDGRRGAPAREYALGDGRWETRARILGARSLTASGSRAFADTSGPVQPEFLPFAAFDGLADTAWRSGPPRGNQQPWLEVELGGALDLASVTVLAADDGADSGRQALRVVTDRGASPVVRVGGDQAVTIPLPPGRTSSLRVVGASTPSPAELAIAEVRIDGVDVDRTLVLPEPPQGWGAPDGILLSAAAGRDACVRVRGDIRCTPGRERAGEDLGLIDRTLRLPDGGSYSVSATAGPVDGDALQGLIQRNQLITVRGSSTGVDDPRASAISAVDGDLGTTWLAEPDDDTPRLSLSWIGRQEVTGIRLRVDEEAAASVPTRLDLVYPGGRQTVELDGDGEADVRPFRADRLEVHVSAARRALSQGGDGARAAVGVGISELRLDGLGLLPMSLSDVPADIGCGFGPSLRIGEELFQTSVIASPRDLYESRDVDVRVCASPLVDLPAGTARVAMSSAPAFRPLALVMKSGDAAASAAAKPVAVTAGSAERRELDLAAPASDGTVVTLPENTNPGWEATASPTGGASAVTVDGWQQGWRLSAGVERLHVRYAPDPMYRASLLAGGAGLALLAIGALAPRRRRHTSDPAVDERRLPGLAVVLLGLTALGLVAGWLGVALGVLGAAVSVTLRRWLSEDLADWAGCLPLLGAAFLYWLRPLGSADGWAGALTAPQLFVAFTLGAVSGALLPGSRTSFHRMLGRSTTR